MNCLVEKWRKWRKFKFIAFHDSAYENLYEAAILKSSKVGLSQSL